jgi:hypothetical protein
MRFSNCVTGEFFFLAAAKSENGDFRAEDRDFFSVATVRKSGARAMENQRNVAERIAISLTYLGMVMR